MKRKTFLAVSTLLMWAIVDPTHAIMIGTITAAFFCALGIVLYLHHRWDISGIKDERDRKIENTLVDKTRIKEMEAFLVGEEFDVKFHDRAIVMVNKAASVRIAINEKFEVVISSIKMDDNTYLIYKENMELMKELDYYLAYLYTVKDIDFQFGIREKGIKDEFVEHDRETFKRLISITGYLFSILIAVSIAARGEINEFYTIIVSFLVYTVMDNWFASWDMPDF